MKIEQDSQNCLLSPQMLSKALEGAGVGTWTWDPDTGIATGDPCLMKILGLEGDGDGGLFSAIERKIHPEDKVAFGESRNGLSQGSSTFSMDFRVLSEGSGFKTLREKVSIVADSERDLQKVVGVVWDVTEESQLVRDFTLKNVELERANRKMHDYFYVISHDLQAPVRHMAAYVNFLNKDLSGKLSESNKDSMDIILSACSRLKMLVSGLVKVADIELKKEDMVECRLSSIFQSVVSEYGSEIESGKLSVEVGDLPTIMGDEALLTQLFFHLLGNAIQYRNKKNQSVIKVSATTFDDSIDIRFSDNGVGFNPKFNKEVFRLFRRLHPSIESHSKGLGLTLCDRIVELHGGEISIDSQLDEGTEVLIRLPRR